MAGSVNRVILVGNVGKDPESRAMQDGTKIVNLILATSESWKDRSSGERKERVEWTRVAIFNDRLAGLAEQYVKKGALLAIEGSLQTRKWTDKDGRDNYTTEVVIGRFNGSMTMLDRQGGGGGPSGQQHSRASSASASRQQSSAPDGGFDEIPF
jgi:single-strand DNA-binding protein